MTRKPLKKLCDDFDGYPFCINNILLVLMIDLAVDLRLLVGNVRRQGHLTVSRTNQLSLQLIYSHHLPILILANASLMHKGLEAQAYKIS
jgi:hypothetical protein